MRQRRPLGRIDAAMDDLIGSAIAIGVEIANDVLRGSPGAGRTEQNIAATKRKKRALLERIRRYSNQKRA